MENIVTHLKPEKLIVFGEVLYDCFPDGRRVLGGAPFNVAWSLKGFGREPVFVSSVGNDDEGNRILLQMKEWGLSTPGVHINPSKATGEVLVSIKDDEPSYDICADRAWDHIPDTGFVATDWIYHGLLALRSKDSRDSLREIVSRSNARRFFDINLRPPYVDRDLLNELIHEVDWLKLNIDELRLLMEDSSISFESAKPAIQSLRDQYRIGNVLLTGGSQGAIILGDSGEAELMPAPSPDPLVDTVGAGDAFSAATIDGLIAGRSVSDIIISASDFAAGICSLRGATTDHKPFYNYA